MSKYKALLLDLVGTTVPNNPDGMPSIRVIEADGVADAIEKFVLK